MKARRLALVPLVLTPLLALWGLWLEPSSLRNEDHALQLPGWPSECDGLKLAVLTDLHVGSPFYGLDKLADVVAVTQKASPDLILLAGDYVIHGVPGGTFTPPEEAAEILADLRAPAGVFAVLGNHDWWLDARRVRAALEGVGIPVLDDRSVAVSLGECRFRLAGISDFWEGPHDVDAALAEATGSEPVIAFTHNPDVFPEIPDRVTLTVAGHTHGGQVYIPGIGRPGVPSKYGERFAIGHVVEEGRHLFVSSGLGTSVFPVRFLVPPEVSMLVLSPPRTAPPGGSSR